MVKRDIHDIKKVHIFDVFFDGIDMETYMVPAEVAESHHGPVNMSTLTL